MTLLRDFSLGFCDFAMLFGLLIDLLFCDNFRFASSASYSCLCFLRLAYFSYSFCLSALWSTYLIGAFLSAAPKSEYAFSFTNEAGTLLLKLEVGDILGMFEEIFLGFVTGALLKFLFGM